jgi:hypothetical protein
MKDGVRLVCRGSAKPSSDLVPKALAMVDRLREVDDYGYQQWQISDTRRIDVKLNGSHATIWIWEGDEDEETKTCPLYLSGMTWDGVRISRPDPNTGKTINGVRWFQAKSGGGWKITDSLGVDVNSLASTPFFAPGNGPDYWRAVSWAQVATLHACAYSGWMRQVVQVLLGMDAVVPYRYDVSCTHGVWGNGGQKDWLIEISATNGVLAMPLPMCVSTVPKESVLAYVPTGETFPTGPKLNTAIQQGRVRRLLSASALEPFYSKTPLFGRCGWAYSRSGRKACNIASSADTLTLNGTVCNLPRMSMFEITIGEDQSGNPSSATFAMIETGIAIGGSGNGALRGQIRYPADDAVSITFAPALPIETLADYADVQAPLYCWYDGEDMQVVRIRTTPNIAGRPSDENPKPRYPGNALYPNPDGPMYADDYWLVVGASNLGKEYVEYPIAATATLRNNRSMSSPIFGASTDIVYTGQRTTYYGEATGFTIINTGHQSFPAVNMYTPVAVARVRSKTSSGITRNSYDCVVVPPLEREGIVHYRYTVETQAGPINSRIDTYRVSYRGGIYEAPLNTAWDVSPLTINYKLHSEGATVPYTLNAIVNLSGVGGIIRRDSTAAYGENYRDTPIPSTFQYISGVTDTASAQEVIDLLSQLNPVTGSETTNNSSKTITVNAKFIGTGGVLVDMMLDPTDMDINKIGNKWTMSNPETDGTLHAFMCMRSANGKLYHISPNIDNFGWGCSNFGTYQAPPDQAKNWTINFVGETDGAVSSFTELTGKVLNGYGNAQVVTSASMVTGHALSLDGTGDYLKIIGTSMVMGAASFTADCEAIVSASGFIMESTGGGKSWALYVDSNGKVSVQLEGGAWKIGAISVNNGVKHHIAFVRNTSTCSLYIDGVKDGADFNYGNDMATATSFTIGANTAGALAMTGSIGYVRVTPGVARWTTNFTPPTLADLAWTYSNTITSAMQMSDSSAGMGIYMVGVSEHLTSSGGVTGIWFSRLTEAATFGANSTAFLQAIGVLSQGLSVAANIASKVIFGELLVSDITLSSTSLAKLLMNASVVQKLELSIADLNSGLGDEEIKTWCANLNTAAHSRYAGYGFNSFAKFEGRHYGCKADGIYELGGERDGGDQIPWTVTFAETDFGSDQVKRMPYAYIGAKASGDLVLKVSTSPDVVHFFDVKMSTMESRTGRARIANGVHGRYWKVELASDTERVELDSIEFFPVTISRRV